MSKVNLLSSMNGLADSEVRDALECWCSQVDFSRFYLAVHLDAGHFFSLLENESIDVPSGMTESDFWQCLPIATHAPIKGLLLSPSSMRKRTIQVACDDQQQRWLECAIHNLTDAGQSSLILVREVSNQHAEALAFQQEKLRAIAYDRFKFSVLELVLKEQNIACILKKIVNDIEMMHDEMHVAIVLTEDLGQAVQTVIAPSLPVALHNTLSQLHIEAGNGSLATAVAMKQRVIVENVMSHPYWVNHREAARASGVLSGWAEPILNAAGDVQGAFAIYYRQRQTPSDLEQSMMEQTARLVSIVIDRHLSQASLQNLTSLEPVTGLPNRRRAYEVLAQHSERACGQSYGLIYLDLDHFKWINEAHGHDVGNQLLAQVTERLQKVAQAHFIACMGGDEFLIMISDLAPKRDQALEQLWHLQHKLEKCLTKPFKIGAQKLPLTASMGLCCVSEDDTTDTDYLKAADIAMHKAKQAGRHQACVYEPGMQTEIASQIMLEAELREAIAQQQFRLYYQVQVDHMGRPFGAEVLLRWHHPQRGVIMPMAFISVAETSGLIVDIGTWVLDQACAQLARWQPLPETRELSLSVNISARQFRQANFVAMVKDCLNRHQINPNALRLELTESLLLENVDDAVRIMQELSELGIQFSLDDFGTGFSSLQYLKKLPLYQLKIDRSFVNDIATDSHDRTIVRTIIVMAQSMYLNVIAEGVETQEQMELLLNNGCRRYQGYLFGRPVPIEQFEEWLQEVMV